MKAHYEKGGLGDMKCKRFLFNVLEDTLTPIREKRKYYEDKKNADDSPAVFFFCCCFWTGEETYPHGNAK